MKSRSPLCTHIWELGVFLSHSIYNKYLWSTYSQLGIVVGVRATCQYSQFSSLSGNIWGFYFLGPLKWDKALWLPWPIYCEQKWCVSPPCGSIWEMVWDSLYLFFLLSNCRSPVVLTVSWHGMASFSLSLWIYVRWESLLSAYVIHVVWAKNKPLLFKTTEDWEFFLL